MQILQNNGTGLFPQSGAGILTLANIGNTPHVIKTGDIDHNGQQDLVVGNQYDQSLTVLFNNGSSSGVPYAAANLVKYNLRFDQQVGDLVVADFNGDQVDDIATANFLAAGNVSIYLNNPSAPGALKPPQTITAGSYSQAIAALDLDLDGDLDLVISNYNDATLRMLRNNGSGTFTQFGNPIPVDRSPASIAVGDFHTPAGGVKNGRLDLAVANYGQDSVSILFANGNFSFATQKRLSLDNAGPTSVVAGDIDDDGDVDLIVARGQTSGSGGISILRNRGTGDFSAESKGVGVLSGISTFNVALGKLDADKLPDLVVTNGFTSTYSVLTNEIVNQGSHQVRLSTGEETVAALDFKVKQTVSSPPSSIDLLSGFDSGTSNTDNVTNLNNGAVAQRLKFRVTGTIPGAKSKAVRQRSIDW